VGVLLANELPFSLYHTRKAYMNEIKKIKQSKVSYTGNQIIILKYLGMRDRMGKPVATLSEIVSFNPERFKRKDTILRTLKVMVKNNFIKEKNNGYVITNIGKQVPFVVADLYINSLSKQGKRTHFANDDMEY
jgi:paraquat-inducible protein B